MTQELVHEICGKKYVLVEVPIIEDNASEMKLFIKRHGLLYQGIKEVTLGGWWNKGFVIQTYFCPEENFVTFSQESQNDLK